MVLSEPNVNSVIIEVTRPSPCISPFIHLLKLSVTFCIRFFMFGIGNIMFFCLKEGFNAR